MKSNKDEEAYIRETEEALIRLEARLQDRYSLMGKNLLELADNEQRSINQIVEEIIQTKNKLAIARHEQPCPHCMIYNPEDSKYCRNCGRLLQPK